MKSCSPASTYNVSRVSLNACQEASASNDTIIYVFVYNPLAQDRSTYVRIPVSSEAVFRVERIDVGEKSVSSQAVVKGPHYANVTNKQYELLFPTESLPPLSIVVFRIIKEAHVDPISMTTMSPGTTSRRLRTSSRKLVQLQNGAISATFDASTGLLTEVSADGVAVPVNQTWGYYTSFDSAMDSTIKDQNSGAYIFRPSVPNQKLINLIPKLNAAKFVETPVGIDVYAYFEEPWIWQMTRIQNNSQHIEIEYHVGPIPISDKRGKEIVVRYSTPITSKGEFFTDANGREFQKRKRNFRPTWDLDIFEPVAGNYYPVNVEMYIEDSTASFAVLVDRSQGGASLIDGSVEMMIQRRTLADDSRGVDEPLNETCGGMSPYPPYGMNERFGNGVSIIGKHRIMIGKGMEGEFIARSGMDDIFAEPQFFVGSTAISEPAIFRKTVYKALVNSLQKNIMIITFSKMNKSEDTIFIRLGHQYNIKDSLDLNKPQMVDMSLFFANKNISSIRETTLTGNQDFDASFSRRLNWNGSTNIRPRLKMAKNSTQVYLFPLEIRSYVVTLTSDR